MRLTESCPGIWLDEDELVTSVFASLKHPTRRRILRELGGSAAAMSFSQLMKAAGVEDSGTFGFHLRALGPILEQDPDARYALSRLGTVAFGLLSMAESSGHGDPQDRGSSSRHPQPIFQVTVEADESEEPVGLSVWSHVSKEKEKDHRRKVVDFLVEKLKETETAELEPICEIQVRSSPDGKSTQMSQNWMIQGKEDRKKWMMFIISKLEADLEMKSDKASGK